LPGTPVKTKKGFVNIEDIRIGDWVWTHKGRWKRVIELFKRDYRGDIIQFSNHGLLSKNVWMTAEHPDLLGKMFSLGEQRYILRDWAKAKNIKMTGALGLRDHELFLCAPKSSEKTNMVVIPDIFSEINPNDFWWMCGLWIAEGTVNKKTVAFHLSFEEKDTLAVKLAEIFAKTGKKTSITTRERIGQNKQKPDAVHRSSEFSIYWKELGDFLLYNFGKYCDKKRIPEDLWDADFSITRLEKVNNDLKNGAPPLAVAFEIIGCNNK
jgi:hypothetical protein